MASNWHLHSWERIWSEIMRPKRQQLPTAVYFSRERTMLLFGGPEGESFQVMWVASNSLTHQILTKVNLKCCLIWFSTLVKLANFRTWFLYMCHSGVNCITLSFFIDLLGFHVFIRKKSCGFQHTMGAEECCHVVSYVPSIVLPCLHSMPTSIKLGFLSTWLSLIANRVHTVTLGF